ncbi:expressed unknown protein [Seminavis robusta]|uniref:Uncharacterized protein n=1 Tax=Seminavis robusta TaxID=568900 RepID=A0A9N8DWG0_9STRA|nr:expressed unknown protein [Seminavis robusta]|eukprot:Sro332_g119310.1 n/a (163) ;mRNA; r:40418-40906
MTMVHDNAEQRVKAAVPRLTMMTAARFWMGDKASEDDNAPVSVEQLQMDMRDPAIHRLRRLAGLKRHHAATKKDSCYETVHPKALDIRGLVDGKSKRIKKELTKQDVMIKSQGQDLTKKYQLIHSDLGELLRSMSDGASPCGHGNSNNNDDNGSPHRLVTST